jgi:tagatose 6-phosphate kinase
MILCVTSNPALDRIFLVENFAPGRVLRASGSLLSPGGKGTNVARGLKALGLDAVCAGLLGDGGTATLFDQLVRAEKLTAAWTSIAGETRTSIIVVDSTSGEATVVNEEGITISGEDWARFRADVLRAASDANTVCLCGTLPPGAAADAPADLIGELKRLGKPVWVDVSGEGLRRALGAKPDGIKINAIEAAAITGLEARGPVEARAAARRLLQTGVGTVVVTLGGRGAILATEGAGLWARPPDLVPVNVVGSGDAFLAGFVGALSTGAGHAEALGRGAAAGAANALSLRPGHFELADFQALLPKVAVLETLD